MDLLELDELKKQCLLAAIKGYTASGLTPEKASKNSIKLVRCISSELCYQPDTISIEKQSKIQQLEGKIGRKLDDTERYRIEKAFDLGMSIEEFFKENPSFLNVC
ncbi:hypothetical protein [Vibrio sp. R78045]|uniref:hypothetical protein n=1 Tax=Vibrio sp. R78045 TaxID=3093868 RepID=UPI0036F2444E